MQDKNLIIDLKEVGLKYINNQKEELTILENINLQVEQGKSLSIIGPSGSGKTSLLMLLAGIQSASLGKIKIAGREINNLDEDELSLFRKENIAIIFQDFHLIQSMTALQNVMLALELKGVKNKEAEKLSYEALELVNLKQRARHYPDQLSGGEKQRVAMARAFAVKPKLLLADEPTGNLDEENAHLVTNLLFKLVKEFNSSLVLVTHDSELAKRTDTKFLIKDHKLS